MRARGIWVDPEFRRYGVAQILFDMTEKQAKKENCDAVWSMPRKSALPAYEKFGFVKQGDFFDEGVEFGPNCWVLKRI